MRKKKTLKFDLTKTVCNFLILMAPAVIAKPYSTLFWGEVPVPDILNKDNLVNKN